MHISTFNSFKSRNFNLFFAGQSLSLIGTWMQKTAVSWVVYSITQSKFMLGVTVFSTLFPTALFSIFGGVVSDRHNRYKVLLVTQILSFVQAILLFLAIIFFTHHLVWAIILLSMVLGTINSFDVPARQSLVRELINNPSDLPNALALNSSMVNLSKLIGPTLAGFIIEEFGDSTCFLINALSFIPVIMSLMLIKLPPFVKPDTGHKKLSKEVADTFRYIRSDWAIASVIVFVGMMNFFVIPFTTLTPVFAKDIFHGTASTFGIIDGVIGLGAFAGALFLASLKPGRNLGKVLVVGSAIFGIGLCGFAYMTSYVPALCSLMVTGFGMMSIITLSNTLIQVKVPDHFRGRVLSIFVLVLTSALPLGGLMVGTVSQYLGVQLTVFIEGVIAVIVALYYLRYLNGKEARSKNETGDAHLTEKIK